MAKTALSIFVASIYFMAKISPRWVLGSTACAGWWYKQTWYSWWANIQIFKYSNIQIQANLIMIVSKYWNIEIIKYKQIYHHHCQPCYKSFRHLCYHFVSTSSHYCHHMIIFIAPRSNKSPNHPHLIHINYRLIIPPSFFLIILPTRCAVWCC